MRQLPFEEAVKETAVERLSVLTSGPVPPNPSELLGSKMMEKVVETATSHFDIVLFDCPPLLAVTDAQVIANYCQGVVLVVKSGVTEIEAAQKAVENLEQVQAKLLGVVLNDKPMNGDSYYYYYYGG